MAQTPAQPALPRDPGPPGHCWLRPLAGPDGIRLHLWPLHHGWCTWREGQPSCRSSLGDAWDLRAGGAQGWGGYQCGWGGSYLWAEPLSHGASCNAQNGHKQGAHAHPHDPAQRHCDPSGGRVQPGEESVCGAHLSPSSQTLQAGGGAYGVHRCRFSYLWETPSAALSLPCGLIPNLCSLASLSIWMLLP